MKKALTLIELIFTIIIIGITFTVIPKIIIVSNKTLETTLKEEVVFNMMAKMIDLSFKEYD
ncbi:MAG: prepilin-type N-terminal cleavage/methylation domain-containing protein, partial [Nautiliaceae bacterium]